VAGSTFAVKAVSSGLGLGYMPVLPGTWATLGAGFAYWAVCVVAPTASMWVVAGLAAGTLAVGLVLYRRAQAAYGEKDPRRFVLDEMTGLWLTCLLFRWRTPLETGVAAFLAFRLFDGAKPFPLRELEKLPGPWGVMADDVGAALYSALALWVVRLAVLDRLAGWR